MVPLVLNRRIISHGLEDATVVTQLLEMDGAFCETVLGTMVPMKSFLAYIARWHPM